MYRYSGINGCFRIRKDFSRFYRCNPYRPNKTVLTYYENCNYLQEKPIRDQKILLVVVVVSTKII